MQAENLMDVIIFWLDDESVESGFVFPGRDGILLFLL